MQSAHAANSAWKPKVDSHLANLSRRLTCQNAHGGGACTCGGSMRRAHMHSRVKTYARYCKRVQHESSCLRYSESEWRPTNPCPWSLCLGSQAASASK
eukprot:1159677-Pelagomonas_calceolata.AAC.10